MHCHSQWECSWWLGEASRRVITMHSWIMWLAYCICSAHFPWWSIARHCKKTTVSRYWWVQAGELDQALISLLGSLVQLSVEKEMTPPEAPNRWINTPGASISVKSQHPAHTKSIMGWEVSQIMLGIVCTLFWSILNGRMQFSKRAWPKIRSQKSICVKAGKKTSTLQISPTDYLT